MDLFLSSRQTDGDHSSGTDTPQRSVDFGNAWPEECSPGSHPAVVLSLSEMLPQERSTLPHSNIWSGPSAEPVQRKTSKQSDITESTDFTDSGSKNDMPTDKKKALVKFIYLLMQQKGLNDPKGHLLMDVYVEIWQEVVGGAGACGGRVAFHRFADMLRTAPEYFELFHIGISVDELGRSGSQKQRAKMVRLVKQPDAVDGGLTPRYVR
jgi:hypothetical protein